MDLEHLLAVPYALEAETVVEDGVWKRRLSYPELPGCQVEGTDLYALVEQLEQRRVRFLRSQVDMVDALVPARSPLVEGPYCLAEASLSVLTEHEEES